MCSILVAPDDTCKGPGLPNQIFIKKIPYIVKYNILIAKSKLGTFNGSFKSSVLVYALLNTHSIIVFIN